MVYMLDYTNLSKQSSKQSLLVIFPMESTPIGVDSD